MAHRKHKIIRSSWICRDLPECSRKLREHSLASSFVLMRRTLLRVVLIRGHLLSGSAMNWPRIASAEGFARVWPLEGCLGVVAANMLLACAVLDVSRSIGQPGHLWEPMACRHEAATSAVSDAVAFASVLFAHTPRISVVVAIAAVGFQRSHNCSTGQAAALTTMAFQNGLSEGPLIFAMLVAPLVPIGQVDWEWVGALVHGVWTCSIRGHSRLIARWHPVLGRSCYRCVRFCSSEPGGLVGNANVSHRSAPVGFEVPSLHLSRVARGSPPGNLRRG